MTRPRSKIDGLLEALVLWYPYLQTEEQVWVQGGAAPGLRQGPDQPNL